MELYLAGMAVMTAAAADAVVFKVAASLAAVMLVESDTRCKSRKRCGTWWAPWSPAMLEQHAMLRCLWGAPHAAMIHQFR